MSTSQQREERAAHKLAEVLGRMQARLEEMKAQGLLPDEPEAPPEPTCPECNDLGVIHYAVPVEHPRFGKLYPCPNPKCAKGNQYRRDRWHQIVGGSTETAIYQDYTFETWDALPPRLTRDKRLARRACELFVTSPQHTFSMNEAMAALGQNGGDDFDVPRNGLVLYGSNGTGKTGLCSAITNAEIERSEGMIYVRAKDMIALAQNTYSPDNKFTLQGIIGVFVDAPILFIDECTLEKKSEDRREIMEMVIRARYAKRAPVLITTNFTPEQFEDFWGIRTYSVLRAMCHWLQVDGVHLRHEGQSIIEENGKLRLGQ